MTGLNRIEPPPLELSSRQTSSGRFLDFLQDRSSRAVNVLAGVSVVVATLVRVVFAHTSGPAWRDDSANLLSDICVGYFPAWFVYYLVSWRPRRQDRDRALVSIGSAALQVAGVAKTVLRHLRAAADNAGTGPISQKELAEMLKDLNISSPVPSIVGWNREPLSALDMFRDAMQRSDERIKQCTQLGLFLDAELLAAFHVIERCSFYATLRLFPPNAVAELTVLVPELYEYFVLCDALRGLLVERYAGPLRSIPQLSIEAVAYDRVAAGALVWRPGAEQPSDWQL